MTFSKVSGTGTVPASVPTDANGNWSQSGFQSGTTYRVTPSKSGYTFAPTYLDFSSASTTLNFTGTIISPIVTVISPNGGETWQAGNEYDITWNVGGNTSNINYFWTAYSTDGGNNFTNIKNASYSDRSWRWKIPPDISSTQCRIRVRALDANGYILAYDISDSNFTIRGSTQQVERITNGSFSSGSSGWTLGGDFWAGTNLTNFRTAPGYAAGGVDSGGYPKNRANGYMYQTVTIPSNATSATLSFWYYITSEEVSGYYDILKITISDSSGSYLATVAVLSNTDKGTSYSQKTFNATSYKGQTIRVNFLATTDSTNATVFRIDDVSLMSDGN